MTVADVGRVMEMAASLPEAPHWPESAYLTALDPASTPRRLAIVALGKQVTDLQGFIVATLLTPEAELESIAIAAASQRLGLGSRLFHAVAAELQAAGARDVFLEVRASNHSALAFYRSLGFSQTGLRRGYYKDPVDDAVVMELRLG